MPEKKTPLEGIVKDIITRWAVDKKEKAEDLMAAWEKAAGPKAFKHSKPVRFAKGTLQVNISDSSWLYELTLRKRDILDKLNSKLKGGKKIKEIRFRIGDTGK